MNFNYIVYKIKSTYIGRTLADYTKYKYPALWGKMKNLIIEDITEVANVHTKINENIFVDSFVERVSKKIG